MTAPGVSCAPPPSVPSGSRAVSTSCSDPRQALVARRSRQYRRPHGRAGPYSARDSARCGSNPAAVPRKCSFSYCFSQFRAPEASCPQTANFQSKWILLLRDLILLLLVESLDFMKFFLLAKQKWFGSLRSGWDTVSVMQFCSWHMAVRMQRQISLINPKIVRTVSGCR